MLIILIANLLNTGYFKCVCNCSFQHYKDSVLEPMLLGTEKVPASITEYREYNTDVTVRFVVKMNPAKLKEAERKGLHKAFNLQSSLVCNNTLVRSLVIALMFPYLIP